MIRVPLAVRLVLTLTLGLVVLAWAMVFALSTYLEDKLIEDQIENLRSKMLTTEHSLEYLWNRSDPIEIRKTIAMLVTDPHIDEALFVDHRMRVVASSNEAHIGHFLRETVGEARFELIRDAVGNLGNPLKTHVWLSPDHADLYGITLISLGGAPGPDTRSHKFGALFVEVHFDYSRNALVASIVWESLPYLVFVLACLMFLVVYVYRGYILRIQRIRGVVQQFFERGRAAHSGFTGSDELADLGNSVVQLIQQVSRQHDTIASKERDLKIILDSICDGVIAIDLDGNVIRLNRAATALTGWTHQEARGIPVSQVFHLVSEATGLTLDMSLQEQLFHEGDITVEGAVLVSKNGHKVHVSYSVSPILEPSSELRGAVLVFQNVTEATEARRILDEIARGVTADPSTTFFDNLALNLYRLFRVKYVTIGLIGQENRDQVNTLVFCEQGRISNNITYSLPGTPCEQTVSRDICFYPDNLQALFPDDQWLVDNDVVSYMGAQVRSAKGERVGIISLMHDQSMSGQRFFEETLSIFASRVAAEIERIVAYRKLEQAQKRLIQHVNATPVGVIEWDRDFRVMAWNKSAERIFGFSRREAMGKGMDIIVPPELKGYVSELWQGLTAGRGGERSKNENIDKFGNRLLCDWYNTPLYDDNNEFSGLASIIMDVSRERKALQEVVKKENEQREILESMVDGVVTINEHGIVLNFNSAAEKLFGYQAREVVGHKVNMLMTHHDRIHHDSYLSRFYETGKTQVIGDGREVVGQRKDGSTFPFRLAVSELPRGSDGQRRFIGCCQDLTLQKRQEEQIRRTQKMESLGKLTSGVAHDFNNILGIASGYANLLNNHLGEEPKLYKYAREISRACERGAKLTKRMLAFSRDQFQQLSVVDINQLLREERELLEKSLTPSIKLQLKLADSLCPVSIDVSDFLDAMINLVINAMHATQGQGTITITTANKELNSDEARALDLATGDYVAITVADTGEGIPENIRAKIFDPFFTTKKEEGTGLGLSQVFGFARRSHGSIDVLSVQGQGAAFTLYFPCTGDFATVEPETPAMDEPDSVGTETILVVDDEPALRDIVNELLSGCGYRVLLAADASQALEILENHPVDLLFSDIVLPGMDGFDLAAIVSKKYPRIKIQLATGSTYRERPLDDRGKSLQYDVIRKPYHGDFLLRRIRLLLDE